MKIAGFFEEFWPPAFGTRDGSVREYTTPSRHEDAKKITEYLLAGHELFSVMGSSKDVLGSGKSILGGDSIYSDGEWIWRGDLWFYVWTHNVRLPKEFISLMRQNGYAMPAENDSELARLAQLVHDKL
ncbi:hypothetical protein ACF07L_25760 [Streptomyces anulatus]|uniref:hypothetical protein n=1 Tax=Streptomyces anulatus TaxID=1892 RepID=UPI003701AE19